MNSRHISDYEGRGCAEQGVDAKNHGMIYSGRSPPATPSNEPRLGVIPVRAMMDETSEPLSSTSRIRYDKIEKLEKYLVEWRSLGEIHRDDMATLTRAVKERMLSQPSSVSSSKARSGRRKKSAK